MDFKEARNVIVPFGAHKGETVDEVARTDEGLRYLDWLVGQDWIYGDLREALKVYLGDPSIAKEIEEVVRGS